MDNAGGIRGTQVDQIAFRVLHDKGSSSKVTIRDEGYKMWKGRYALHP